MANTFKEDVAIGVAGNLEKQMAASAESLVAERHKADGARGALRLAQERVRNLQKRADAMMDEQALSPDERRGWKRALDLAHGMLESLYQTTDVSVHELDGQVKAFSKALAIATKTKDAYRIARQAILDSEDSEEAADGETGERAAPRGSKDLHSRNLELLDGGAEEDDASDPEDGDDEEDPDEDDGVSELDTMVKNNTKDQLQDMARKLSVPISGTKPEIARRILGHTGS